MREKKDIIEDIRTIINDYLYKPMFPAGFAAVLKLSEEDTENLDEALSELENRGEIFFSEKGKCVPPEMLGLHVGIFRKNIKGFGFVTPVKAGEKDIFINRSKTGKAMDRDLVAARIISKERFGERREGEIVKIIRRNTEKTVCTFFQKRGFGIAEPINKKDKDIFIRQENILNAVSGDKVVVELTDSKKSKSPEGRVVEILGHKGDKGLNILSVLREQGFKEGFTPEALKEAEKIPDMVREKDLEGRTDLREKLIFTIDGDDTKDIDDAISLEITGGGNYLLGVHIADVSHYIKSGSHLDTCAYEKGTSVYPPDRVEPMLPKKLSNGICSLNPRTDRLALSVSMEIDTRGNVVSHDIFKSVIRSREQMTYNNVYKILEKDDLELKERYKELVSTLFKMKELALLLRKRRFERGAIDFDIPEPKVILDEKDNPTDIIKREITIANILIEEMMLICNETVAEHFFWMEVPFVYRIHENPDEEKLNNFLEFLKVMGYKVKGGKNVHSAELQRLLERVKGKPEERVISTLMLRAMQKAKYSPENQGHYGLGAPYYCHFTSPIRRYPDLIIHRIISQCIYGQMDKNKVEHYKNILGEAADHCSERERAAEAAERECVKLKMAEYMINHIGEEFPCIVSGVARFGMFVETENLIEGFVPMENLLDDYYVYDEKQYMLIGEHTNKRYRIGDSVTARAVRADTGTRSIEFAIGIIYNNDD